MYKKVIMFLMTAVFIVLFSSTIYATNNTIKVKVNDEFVKFDTVPVMSDESVLVPIRAILNKLSVPDSDITYKDGTINIKKDNKLIELKIDSASAKVNGKNISLIAPARLINDRTYIPARFIAENLDCKVEWDEKNNTVRIYQQLNDSCWRFSMPTEYDQIAVCLKFGEESRWTYFKNVDGQVKGNVYFPFGPGLYKIFIESVKDNGDAKRYTLIKSMQMYNNDSRDLSYLLPSQNIESDSQEIINLAKEITKDSTTDMEKTRAIHDWVARNIAYDVEGYHKSPTPSYSALDTLHGKKAVCNGYANLVAALNRAIGLKAKVVSGIAIWANTGETWENTSNKKSNHAWNEVYIDGKWIVQDATWDAGYVNSKIDTFTFKYTDKYFNPMEKNFAIDHKKLEESKE